MEIAGEYYLMDNVTRKLYFYFSFSVLILLVLLSLFVIYVIMYYSTYSVSIYKWYMGNSVFWTLFHALNLFMIQPIPVYPHFMFIVNGPVSFVNTKALIVYQPLVLTSTFAACCSVGFRFFFRYVKICNQSCFHYFLNVKSKTIIFVSVSTVLISTIFTVPFHLFQLPPQRIRSNMSAAASALMNLLNKDEALIGYDMPSSWFVAFSTFMMASCTFFVVVMLYSTLQAYRTVKQITFHSNRVNFLFRIFKDSLMVETLLALILYVLAGVTLLNLVLFPRYINYLLPLLFTFSQMYGLVECLSILFFVEPYRKACKIVFSSCKSVFIPKNTNLTSLSPVIIKFI